MGGNMGLLPTKKRIEHMKHAFPKNARVELVWMDDVYRRLPAGAKGRVDSVDDIGNIHVHWDNECRLGVVWNADVVKNVETGVLSNMFWGDDRPAMS